MAEALFGRLSKHQVTSAGVRVSERGWDGRTIQEIANDPSSPPFLKFTLGIMADEGFDLSGTTAKQLTPEMADKADRIIALCPKENLPNYLLHNDKVAFDWIRMPGEMTYESFIQVKNEIREVVEKLVKETG
jgi:protein-tyrosine-phosphatase